MNAGLYGQIWQPADGSRALNKTKELYSRPVFGDPTSWLKSAFWIRSARGYFPKANLLGSTPPVDGPIKKCFALRAE